MMRFWGLNKFLERLFPSPTRAVAEASKARVLARLHAAAPEEIAAFRFRPAPLPQLVDDPLQPIDADVIRAIGLLPDRATNRTVSRAVEKLTSQKPSYFKVNVSIDRLTRHGLVVRREWGRGDQYEYCYALTWEGRHFRAVSLADEKLVDLAEVPDPSSLD